MSFFNFNSYNSSSNMSRYINEKLQKINDKYFKNKNIKKPLQFYYNYENGNININKKIDILHLYKTEQNKLNYYFLNNFSNDFLKKVFSISNLIYDILNIYRLILEYNYKQRQTKDLALIDIYEYIYFIINNNENTIKATLNSTNELLNLIQNIKAKNINSIGFYENNNKLEYIINKSYSYEYYLLYYLLDSDSFKNDTKIFNEKTNPINIQKLENKMKTDICRANYKIIFNNTETNYNLSNNNNIENKKDKLRKKFIDDLKNNISEYLKTNKQQLFNNTLIKILQSIYQVVIGNIYKYIHNIYIKKYFILVGLDNFPIKFSAIKQSYAITFKENNILIEINYIFNSVVLDVYSKINIDFLKNTVNEKINFKWKNEKCKNIILFGSNPEKTNLINELLPKIVPIQKQIYNILKLNNKKINKNTIEYIRNIIINSNSTKTNLTQIAVV
jgi:hypothetical protein